MNQRELHTSFTDINIQQWNDLINHSSFRSYFQTPECYLFYSGLSFLKPFVYGISEYGELKGVISGYIIADGGKVVQYFSRRAIVQGGVLLSENISKELVHNFLIEVLRQLSSKVIYIEIRNNHDYSTFLDSFENAGLKYEPHLNYQIDLRNPESLIKNVSESKRRQINIAQRNGISWEVSEKKEDIYAYYCILKNLYKTKIKRPLFPLEFFEKLVCLPEGRLLVVKKDNMVIGGMSCFIYSDNTTYELFVCGDSNVEKYYYPSVMATWAGIEYSMEQNITCFDFMGAGKPDREYGVREFKSRFGGKLVEYGRFKYICNPFLYSLGSFVIEKLTRKMKVL